jgi:NAD(P)-dependent dehydrogenase (short-subunit alcohol dehydrogenase family)
MGLEQFSLEGSVAVVTGGSRGIGEAIAVEMAEAGATVVPVARSADDLDETVERIESAGGEAIACTMDVTDAESVAAALPALPYPRLLGRCRRIAGDGHDDVRDVLVPVERRQHRSQVAVLGDLF